MATTYALQNPKWMSVVMGANWSQGAPENFPSWRDPCQLLKMTKSMPWVVVQFAILHFSAC